MALVAIIPRFTQKQRKTNIFCRVLLLVSCSTLWRVMYNTNRLEEISRMRRCYLWTPLLSYMYVALTGRAFMWRCDRGITIGYVQTVPNHRRLLIIDDKSLPHKQRRASTRLLIFKIKFSSAPPSRWLAGSAEITPVIGNARRVRGEVTLTIELVD